MVFNIMPRPVYCRYTACVSFGIVDAFLDDPPLKMTCEIWLASVDGWSLCTLKISISLEDTRSGARRWRFWESLRSLFLDEVYPEELHTVLNMVAVLAGNSERANEPVKLSGLTSFVHALVNFSRFDEFVYSRVVES